MTRRTLQLTMVPAALTVFALAGSAIASAAMRGPRLARVGAVQTQVGVAATSRASKHQRRHDPALRQGSSAVGQESVRFTARPPLRRGDPAAAK